MITDTDIKKMKIIFVTKVEFKKELNVLNSKMDSGFVEIINFISEIKNDIMKELNEFRNEMRDINRGNQSILDNHESRIVHFELK